MPSGAWKVYMPPWSAPRLSPYLWIGAVLGGGTAYAFLLGWFRLDPEAWYVHLPAAAGLTQHAANLAVLLGGVGGVLLGALVWGIATLASWASYRRRS